LKFKQYIICETEGSGFGSLETRINEWMNCIEGQLRGILSENISNSLVEKLSDALSSLRTGNVKDSIGRVMDAYYLLDRVIDVALGAKRYLKVERELKNGIDYISELHKEIVEYISSNDMFKDHNATPDKTAEVVSVTR